MAGLTETGLTIRTQAELEALIRASVAEAFPDVDFDEGPEQQIIGVVSEELAIIWETIQAVYSAAYPAGAQGIQLDQLAAITGTVRPVATRSTVAATVNLNAGVTLPVGVVAAVDGNPDAEFRLVVAVTNGGGVADDIEAEFESLEPGPVAAPSGLLTVIVTPISGWNTITNAEDATPGRERAEDPELRTLREAELVSAGTTPIDAIRADLLGLEGVTDVRVYQNVGDTTDGDGRPPHSVEAVVKGGDEQEIADQLLVSVAAGIQTYGTNESETAEDSQGHAHTIEWTTPTDVELYLEIDLTVDADDWPATDGPGLVRAALIAYQEASLGVGADVVVSALIPTIFGATTGVLDVEEIRIDDTVSPVATANYAIGVREIADFDTSRIVVNVTPV